MVWEVMLNILLVHTYPAVKLDTNTVIMLLY